AGFDIETTDSIESLCQRCNLIVTTPPSNVPLISASDVRPGTHITAVGADTPAKQEIDERLAGLADVVVADSKDQCFRFGELSHAIRHHPDLASRTRELGEVLAEPSLGRIRPSQITLADFTGLAIQDLDIS